MMTLPSRVDGGAVRLDPAGIAQARSVIIVSCLFFDAAMIAFLRGSPSIRQSALWAFAEIAGALLLLDLAITRAFLWRARPAYAAIQMLCVTLEMATGVTWIQLTGTTSSYFIMFGPLLIAMYRSFAGYGTAAWATSCIVLFQAVAFALESAGVLRPASLFVENPSGLYATPLFRDVSIASILLIYVSTFTGSNYVANAIREKEAALSAARRDFEQAVEDGLPGRLVGASVGGYKLVELLGRGGMGEVYEAVSEADDDRRVALKVLHRQFAHDAQVVARFQREVEVVRRLSSRGIAAVTDSGVASDGLRWLAMELLRGEDLGARLRRRGRIPLAEMVPIVAELAQTLDEAHAAGIVHRDVKPQNIFLLSEPAKDGALVKLLDFGVARLSESSGEPGLTATAAVLGTPGFLAPEQIAPSLGEVGPETDLFALGAVVYRAITGRPAFNASHLSAAIHAALHVHPPPPSETTEGLPKDVDSVIALALAKRPRHRYGNARAFADDLRAALAGTLPDEVRQRAREFAGFGSTNVDETIPA
jgi:serine/threonine-protein kinase